MLTASPKTPWNDWKELLADAKARPGQITVGATLGSTSHFFPALIEKAAGIKFKYVSYEGLAPRMNAILGGHIDLTDSNLTQKGKVEAGQLKFIAIATEKRNPEMPNVPTLKELGVNVVYDGEPRPAGAQGHAGRRAGQARVGLRGDGEGAGVRGVDEEAGDRGALPRPQARTRLGSSRTTS